MTTQLTSKSLYNQQLIFYFDRLLNNNSPKPKFIKKCLEILNQEKAPLEKLEIKRAKLIKKASCESKVIYSIAAIFAVTVLASFSASLHFFSNNDHQTAFFFLKMTVLLTALSAQLDYKEKPHQLKLDILNKASAKAFNLAKS